MPLAGVISNSAPGSPSNRRARFNAPASVAEETQKVVGGWDGACKVTIKCDVLAMWDDSMGEAPNGGQDRARQPPTRLKTARAIAFASASRV
jgi:hypothetical protein